MKKKVHFLVTKYPKSFSNTSVRPSNGILCDALCYSPDICNENRSYSAYVFMLVSALKYSLSSIDAIHTVESVRDQSFTMGKVGVGGGRKHTMGPTNFVDNAP